jgi:MFS family permease
VATQLRRQDVGPAEIGAFVGSFYLPWAFKWAFGPLIDVFASDRLGRRRGWILLTQTLMVATLLVCTGLDLPAQLGLLTAILLVHNSFGAMQDVAIDALAVNTLAEGERGLANGLMFAGASLGQALGGAGVLAVIGVAGFEAGVRHRRAGICPEGVSSSMIRGMYLASTSASWSRSMPFERAMSSSSRWPKASSICRRSTGLLGPVRTHESTWSRIPFSSNCLTTSGSFWAPPPPKIWVRMSDRSLGDGIPCGGCWGRC